ncbi:MAG: hypothetical protein MSC30_17550 [Gaiellaceae bacterium MAG52_C11]|nr:hypothetical protein [Candidatus Gaiellasilicea maunaloa]
MPERAAPLAGEPPTPGVRRAALKRTRSDHGGALGRLGVARGQASEFGRVYSWLLRDVLSESRLRAIAVAALNLVAAALQWASVLILLSYVNAQVVSGAGGLGLPGLEDLQSTIGDSRGTLVIWGASALTIAILGAVIGYRAQVMGFDIARRYSRRAGAKIISAVESNSDLLTAASRDQGEENPVRILRSALLRETTFVLRSLFLIIRSSQFLARLLVAGGLLVFIDPLLTAALLGLGLLFAVPLYEVNRKTAAASVEYERSNLAASRFASWLANLVIHSDRSSASEGRLSSLYERSRAVDDRHRALSDIHLAHYRAQYLLVAFAGLAAVAVLFAFGFSGTDDVDRWTTALLYIAALLAASASLTSTSATVTAMSRFAPQVRRYTRLVRGADTETEARQPSSEPCSLPDAIRVGPEQLEGSAKEHRVEPGAPIFVFDPQRLDRTSLEDLLRRLFGLEPVEATRMRADAFLCGDIGSLPESPDVAGFVEEMVGMQDGLHADGGDLHFAVTVLQGLSSGAPILALGWRSFSALDAGVRGHLLARAGEATVLVVSERMPGHQPDEVTATVILDQDGVRGIGDASAHREWAQQLRVDSEFAASPKGGAGDLGLDDELDA